MKAFWWFRDDSIAGMARPGFNGIHWFELPFEESLVYSWLGQRTSDSQPIQSLHHHIRDYGSKIVGFFGLESTAFRATQENLQQTEKVLEVFDRVAKKTKCLQEFNIADDKITFKLCPGRLNWEIDFLKKQEIRTVVTLTENHNQKEELKGHFDLHHIAIDDLNAPSFDQVVQLADLILQQRSEQKRIAVHCMAGIGRTSTMLIAAHMVLGERLADLKTEINKRNPSFQFTGSQGEFIHSIEDRL